jgi:hypothetical protein
MQAPMAGRNVMSHGLLVPFLAAACLVAPAMLSRAFVPATTPGFSGSAEAAINLNSSRSNIYRKKHARKTKQPTKPQPAGTAPRMGGGGGHY